MLPAVGQFVESRTNTLGVGKLVGIENCLAKIEYFESPAKASRLTVEVPEDSVVCRRLEPETRVYFENEETLKWQVGRILHYQESDRTYLVRFPNDERRLLPESLLMTRWQRPIDDPTDHLALQLNETPFWHLGRSAFIQSVYAQRRSCGGMPGLLSSAIDLVEHQVSVVQRVLQDPFQRYLLADEVGLGKTIEAGVLIRQYVLDERESHRVLVIVPDSLIRQWASELRERFHLEEELGSSIHIVGHLDLDLISKLGRNAGMVVIDEAHHVSAFGHSSDAKASSIFQAIADATSPPERRVLLLSATPVLHNEPAFLAMLHLIDPLLYSLDDLATFRQRVQHRQQVAELMSSLSEDESNFFLGQTLSGLSQFFPEDSRFHDVQSTLRDLVESDVDESDAERCNLIGTLRTHISETWRLHRRLLRNRRTENTEYLLPGRAGAETREWTSSQLTTLEELVAERRLSAAQSLLHDDVDAETASTVRVLARVIAEASESDPNILHSIVSHRLGECEESDAILFEKELDAIRNAPFFDGEREQLEQIGFVASRFDDNVRLCRLESLIFEIDEVNERDTHAIVVFCNFPETADRVVEFLERKLGSNRIVRHSPDGSGWTRFIGNSTELVLVCDRRAEEGLNLQNRKSVALHFDLPLSANRIEQRMGRLDRFGTGRPVRSYCLVPSQSAIQNAWFCCLNEALQVFNRSIASLQYVIDTEFQQVWSEFPDSGADAISDATARLGGEDGVIETEFRRIRAQDELDAFERDPIADREFVDKLERFDLKASWFRQGLDQWLVDRLHFRSSGEEGRNDCVLRYQFCRRDDLRPRRGEKDTLLPYDEFLRRFERCLDDADDLRRPVFAETKLLAFDRQTAQHRKTRLARIGDPLIDSTEEYLRWDDRGICFAMWRYRPMIQMDVPATLAFRFDIVAEADLSPFLDLQKDWPEVSLSALRRRADMVFPPIVGQLWLDSDLQKVTDQSHGQGFREPYRTTPMRDQRDSGHDFNLNEQRWKPVSEFCDLTVWRGLCYSARERAEELLREESKMPEVIRDCSAKVDAASALRIEQFESRLARTSGDGAVTLHRELEFERAFSVALKTAIERPSVRVDAMGAVFLSPHNPFANEALKEDDD